jgi:hypothetical protein
VSELGSASDTGDEHAFNHFGVGRKSDSRSQDRRSMRRSDSEPGQPWGDKGSLLPPCGHKICARGLPLLKTLNLQSYHHTGTRSRSRSCSRSFPCSPFRVHDRPVLLVDANGCSDLEASNQVCGKRVMIPALPPAPPLPGSHFFEGNGRAVTHAAITLDQFCAAADD